MISKECVEILKFLSKNKEEWYGVKQFMDAGLAPDFYNMMWLYENDCVARLQTDAPYNPYSQDPPYIYRFCPGGEIKLKEHLKSKWAGARSWIALGFSALSLATSIIALAIK